MKRLAFAALTCVATLGAASAYAQGDVVVGLNLEPPHLDPTSAAAGAID